MTDDVQSPQLLDDSSVEHSTQAAKEAMPPKSSLKKKAFFQNPKVLIACGVIVLAAGFSLLTWQVYAKPVTDPFVRKVVQIMPFPALVVEGTTVSLKEFLVEYDSLSRYFDSLKDQTVPPPDQLEIAIADTLVNKLAIEQLAKKYQVSLDKDRVEAYYQDILSSQESEEAFTKNLMETFHWTPDEFRSRIVNSIVLALQMSDAVLDNNDLQQERLSLIQDASKRIASGEDFEMVAKEVHAGFEGIESDLGYVKSALIPESWASQVENLAIGQVSDIVTLPEGYVLFKLVDRTGDGDETQLHLLSITVPKLTLEDVVKTYLETAKVKRYVGQES